MNTLVQRFFLTRIGLLALATVIGHAVWRHRVLSESFFTQHDFVLLQRLNGTSFSLSTLLEPLAGEFSPVGTAIAWGLDKVAPLSWRAASISLLALQFLVSLLLWMVLTKLLDDRWVRLPLFLGATLTPLVLGATTWWSLGLLHLPTAMLFLCAVLALLFHVQDGWRSGPVVAGLALTMALLCNDRTLLLPLAALVVVAGVTDHGTASARARLSSAVRALPRLWAWLAVACLLRLLVVFTSVQTSTGGPGGWLDTADELVSTGLPALVGGPWSGEVVGVSLAADSRWGLALGAVALLLLSVPLRQGDGPVVRVVVLGVMLHLLGGVLLAVPGSAESAGTGTVPLFLADAVPVVVVLLAVGLRRTPVPPALRQVAISSPGFLAVGLAVALLASTAVTTEALLPALRNTDDRAYVSHLTDGVANDPRIVLLDGAAPPGVMDPALGESARVSVVAGVLREYPTFDTPSEHLALVTGEGYVWPVALQDPVRSRPSKHPDCGHRVTSRPREIAMQAPVGGGGRVLRIGYYLSGDTFAMLDVAGEKTTFPVRGGLHTLDIPLQRAFDSVTMSLDSREHTLCVTGLEAGVPVPAQLLPAP